jgi:hypothetical protein
MVTPKLIFEFAAGTRKMLFRYIPLCGTAFDALDAVISATPEAIPAGFTFLVLKHN